MKHTKDMTFEEIVELAKNLPEPTPAQWREHAISWAYGNAALSNPDVTKEMVTRIYDEMHPETAPIEPG